MIIHAVKPANHIRNPTADLITSERKIYQTVVIFTSSTFSSKLNYVVCILLWYATCNLAIHWL